MRIIHTSDWHLGQYFFGKSRANEHKQFLQWLAKEANTHQVDAIIVAGDIFDTGNPPSYARELYFDFIHQLQTVNCQLIVLAGNHDSVAMLAESKQLLASLGVNVIPSTLVATNEQVFTVHDQEGEPAAVICAVPFIRPREIVSSQAGQSQIQKQSALQDAIAEHYHQLYVQAQTLSAGQLPIIGTGHLTTVGASVSDSVREIYIGTLDAFPANAFPNFDYLALGHIHQMQTVAKSAHIRYSGSPIPLSFDEAKQDKYVLLVDVEKAQPPLITPLVVPKFQPLVMVKTKAADVVLTVEKAIAANNSDNSIWLDIEIEGMDYRSDLQVKIRKKLQPYIDGNDIDILLIRRSKAERNAMLHQQQTTTLEELTPNDVFHARLEQSQWHSEKNNDQTRDETNPDASLRNNDVGKDDKIAVQSRLTALFEQMLTKAIEQSDIKAQNQKERE